VAFRFQDHQRAQRTVINYKLLQYASKVAFLFL